MAVKKQQGVLSGVLRDVARDARIETGKDAITGADGPSIFNILEYIEQPWGLWMDGKDNRAALFPAQRFIVKLFYNIELDRHLPEDPRKRIQVMDMFGTTVLHEFSEWEYLQYLYNEGRCNLNAQDHDRRELVLAVGRRAGKCLESQTLTLTDRGLLTLEELGNPWGSEWQPLDVGVAQEGSKKARSAYFYASGERETKKVVTRCGFSVEGTHNHRVRVLCSDLGEVVWKRLDEIQEGDFVGVHRKTDLWPESYVAVRDLADDLGKGLKSYELPEMVDEAWGRLLGVLTGDGTWPRKAGLEVTVGPYPEWLSQVVELLRSTVGEPKVYHPHKRASRVCFFSYPVRRFFHRLGFSFLEKEGQVKQVPWVIRRSPKPVVAEFLRGLFETDGSIERGRIVSFSTASQRLAQEVQLLLLNFGVVSRVKARQNKITKKFYHHLTILGAESVRIFAKEIGFLTARKNKPLQKHVQKPLLNKSATESIPYQKLWCQRLLETVPRNNGNKHAGKLGWRRSYLRQALGNIIKPSSQENLTYPRLSAALEVVQEHGFVEEIGSHFTTLVEQGYFFDPVVSVENGRAVVCDLNVPDGQMFVANGLTNHNTTLSGIFASYEVYRLLNLYNPQEYYGLPNGNRIQIISVATDKDQASLLFNEVSTHINKCDYFKPYLGSSTLSRIDFRTPYDIEKYGASFRQNDGKFKSLSGKTTLRVTFKGSTAKGLRGAGNIIIILDEVAHFQDKGTMSAEEIYQAVSPSAAAFSRKDKLTGRPAVSEATGEADVESRIILISSPLGKSGLFYQKFEQAMQGGEAANNLLAIQAPTWEINPTVPSKYYREKYHENPQSFMVEHGAQFSDQSRGWIEREEDLTTCIDPELRPILRARPRTPHQMGIDLGLVNDGTAVVITHEERGEIVLDYHEVWYAGESWRDANSHLNGEFSVPYAQNLQDVVRLDFDEIADWIAALCKRFHITAGLFDRWNGIPLEQNLHKRGLKQFSAEFFTRDATSKMFQTTKMMLFDERVRLYDYPIPERSKEGGTRHSPFIAELLSLQAKQVSRNIIVVEAPTKPGAHDDLSDAFVRSVWLTTDRMTSQKHTYKGHGVNRPAVATSMTPARYQAMRSRRHGSGNTRQRPTGGGRGGRLVRSKF